MNSDTRSGAFRVGLIFSSESEQAQVYRGECWRLGNLAERLAFSLVDLEDPEIFQALQRSLEGSDVSESLQRNPEIFRQAWMYFQASCKLPEGETKYQMRHVTWNTAILLAAGGDRRRQPPLATILYLLGMCGTATVQLDSHARGQLGDMIDNLLDTGILRSIGGCWVQVRNLLYSAKESVLISHAATDSVPWGDSKDEQWKEVRNNLLNSQQVSRYLSTLNRVNLLMLGSGKTLFDVLGSPSGFIYTPQEREVIGKGDECLSG